MDNIDKALGAELQTSEEELKAVLQKLEKQLKDEKFWRNTFLATAFGEFAIIGTTVSLTGKLPTLSTIMMPFMVYSAIKGHLKVIGLEEEIKKIQSDSVAVGESKDDPFVLEGRIAQPIKEKSVNPETFFKEG